MKPPRRILVAIKNPDARSQAGADKALAIAKTLGASVQFFHAITDPLLLDVAPVKGDTLADIKSQALTLRRQRIERLVSRARALGVDATSAVSWDYPPHEAIVRQAQRMRADLIIAECHQGRRLTPWLMRVTDWELLRTSNIPVLLLKNPRRWKHPVVLASVDPTHSHSKPSGLDEAILAGARTIAGKFRGSTTVMHACYPPLPAFAIVDPLVGGATIAAVYQSQKQVASAAFDKFTARHRIPSARRRIVDLDPAHGIPRLAKKLGADLVVMGAVSRSGLKRVFIGNTAERVLPALACDVLVIKPALFRSTVASRPRGIRLLPQPSVSLGQPGVFA
jgi:universal stress protein E